MTKNEARAKILSITTPNILLELPTGYGKTKLALDTMSSRKPIRILIVVPRIVLISNWQEEIHKWCYDRYLPHITFVTYVSFPKMSGEWDMVIFDECHHLSERCQEALVNFDIKSTILLSATVKDSIKEDLQLLFKDLYCYKVKMKEAIDNDVLPDPRVYLIPLLLNDKDANCTIIKNPKGNNPIKVTYINRWDVIKSKTKNKIEISCTQKEYIDDLDNMISFWKRKFITSHTDLAKNRWLFYCGQRLKWLSTQKNSIVLEILSKLRNERTLTFCNSIDQTNLLGKYSINSSNKEAQKNLELFNTGRIKHLAACNMLNEGMNLVDCRVGIYANLNSSEILITQRLGRILRHKDPIIVIPFFKNTREEELVEKMLENYNPELVTTTNNLNDLNI